MERSTRQPVGWRGTKRGKATHGKPETEAASTKTEPKLSHRLKFDGRRSYEGSGTQVYNSLTMSVPGWDCTYCGAEAYGSQGETFWCHAPRCEYLHSIQFSEPYFHVHLLPTPAQQLLAGIQYLLFRCCWFVPCRWLTHSGNGWRVRLATWVYSGSCWSAERWVGHV